jgi:hypothetical protein
LRDLERLDERAIARLLESTLIGPVERWRQFELALMLAMADAVSRKTGAPVRVENLFPGVLKAAVSVGRYVLRWQRPGPRYEEPALDPWEKREVDILLAFGVSPGYDRPDVVLVDRDLDRTIAVGEAKYFEGDDWRDRLRDAVGQIVTYARGYESKQGDVEDIIARSVIALWNISNQAPAATTRTPFVVAFDDFESGLADWAERALSGTRAEPPFSGNATPSSSFASTAGG